MSVKVSGIKCKSVTASKKDPENAKIVLILSGLNSLFLSGSKPPMSVIKNNNRLYKYVIN
jgi:hypothetical protein